MPFFLALFLATTVTAPKFTPACTSFSLAHMNTIMKRLPFDDACGPVGTTTDKALQAQNTAKNNLCAVGTPATITVATLVALQATKASLPEPPPVRTSLHDVKLPDGTHQGEGKLVRLVAYVQKAKYSDAGPPDPGQKAGESVNCNQESTTDNDVHIALVTDPKDDNECDSVTAEMIPHYRPSAWTPEHFHFLSLFTPDMGHTPYHDYDTTKRPMVRVTGQLFYDASHGVCVNGKRAEGSPAREANWEVHPVYALDVCTITSCDPNKEAGWQAFDAWITHPPTTTKKPSH